MTDKDLRSLYNEYLYFFGLSANAPEVRYLMLDTTEGRYGSYLLAASVAVLIALIVVIRIQIKKNKEKEDCVEIRYN